MFSLLSEADRDHPTADVLTDWYARAVEMNRTIGTRLHIPIGYYDLMNHDEARRAGLDLADVIQIIPQGG